MMLLQQVQVWLEHGRPGGGVASCCGRSEGQNSCRRKCTVGLGNHQGVERWNSQAPKQLQQRHGAVVIVVVVCGVSAEGVWGGACWRRWWLLLAADL